MKKKCLILMLLLLIFVPTADAAWTLVGTAEYQTGNYYRVKVVCTSDGSALTATDLLGSSVTWNDSNLAIRWIQGSSLMLMKLVPGTGGVIPDGTIDIDLEDGNNHDLWVDTGMSQNAMSWHKLYEDLGPYPPVFQYLNLVVNDIGTAGDQITLYIIGWIEDTQ